MLREVLGRRIRLFCLLSFLGFGVIGCKKQAPPPPPPPEVEVITASSTNMPIFQEWIGTMEGFVNAQIRAQVTGYLLTQNYKEGSEVKKGELLFQIDPRPFQAALDQAQAKLAQDQPQLGKTELDVKRYTPLAKEQAISQEELDNAIQANLAAQAQIKADQAAIENGQLNLGFTQVKSPIDGIAGIALAQIGDLVSPAGIVLTTVSALNPMRAYFNVGEKSYLTFWRHLIGSADTNKILPLELILSDGTAYPEKGKFFIADRQVNPNTGTLQIAGLFPNPDLVLRPGQYALVRAQTEIRKNVTVIPQRAVTELQGSYQVIMVDNENKAHSKAVKVGEQTGANWIIEEGVQPGERVVIEGLQKAKENAVVNPKPFVPREQNSGPSASSSTNASPTHHESR